MTPESVVLTGFSPSQMQINYSSISNNSNVNNNMSD